MPENNIPIENRYDLVYLFDVTDGNPNGDPDAGNLPRVDSETGQGLVTDVCLKRKIRNYVALVQEKKDNYEIYIKEKAILNQQHERAYTALKIDPKKRAKGEAKAQEDKDLTNWMCQNFYDIRTFGAVMTTGVNCGQVRGPVQFAIGRSIDPIFSQEHAVTRCAVTTEAESEKQSGDNRTMGRKFTVPYGLYRTHAFINPFLANQTGFGEADLDIFKRAMNQLFEYDRSAARGQMVPRACIAFKHESKLGNARADQLFDRVTVSRSSDEANPARTFADYTVKVDKENLPKGITVELWV